MTDMLIGTAVSTAVGTGLGFVGRALGRNAGNRQPNITFGQRVDDVYLSGSSEGASIRKLWGRMRLGGNLIWCSNFTERTTLDPSFQVNASAGKGGGGGGSQLGVNWTVNYHYDVSFAVAFCEGGPGTILGRVWADGKELDLSEYTWRFYNGSDQQVADTHIESIEGVGNVPAYRGIAYLVFQTVDASKFGNRVPQISAEIIRRPVVTDANDLSNSLKSVCMIPGSGEFVYGTQVYKAALTAGSYQPQNTNADFARADIMMSLDQLVGSGDNSAVFPPAPAWSMPWTGTPNKPTGGNWWAAEGALSAPDAVMLVVSWFGTDLRAGVCQIVPKVEIAQKNTVPADWEVAGYTRNGTAWFVLVNGFPVRAPYGTPGAFLAPLGTAAQVASQIDPSILDPTASGAPVPAFGGTPSDNVVKEAIAEIKRRGLRCIFYPFVMMDIPPGNTLPNPYSANAAGVGQAAFPWRGRITCSPAPGYAGTVDKTATAATQVNAFFDQYDAMVAHYANLCVSAGGVDGFLIGSELVGLTQVRSSPGDGAYPAVTRLKSLAASVRAIVGGATKIGYAADWSEYHSHRPADGTGDVIFNLDPLWSDSNIDFVGIDNYLPISDWRDTSPNADGAGPGAPESIYDRAYLQANVEGGEYFDWYYTSDANRASQTRTPITDGAYGKPWVYRNKDIRSRWSNAHKSRPGGVENISATAWTAGAKPIWFTEFGCAAVDKGTNQPNVFVDPKSSESILPYFSTGGRDDAIQRAYFEAMLSYWRDNAPTIGAIKMVEPKNMFAWAWDARPFPDFPAQASTWRDGYNYELGHWLTGRLTEVPLQWIIAELCGSVGVTDLDTARLLGPDSLVLGAAADGVVSPRDVIEGLENAFQFGAHESGGKIVFASRIAAQSATIVADDLVMESEVDVGYALTRAQETDLPGALHLSFVDAYADYATGTVSERKDVGSSNNVAQVSTPAVLEPPRARSIAGSLLQQAWAGRESATIKLPPSKAALDPSDCLTISLEGVAMTMRVETIDIGTFRTLTAQGFDPSLAKVFPAVGEAGRNKPARTTSGPPIVEILDIPMESGEEPAPYAPRVAAFGEPWTGVSVYRSSGGSNTLIANVSAPTPIGELTDPLYSGPRSVWDMGNAVYVQFYGATTLLSASDTDVFAGANAIAVKNAADGAWEIIQFATATLVAANKYKLSKLLRAQLGTESGMADPIAAGARVVLLQRSSLVSLGMSVDQIGQAMTLKIGPALYDPGDASYYDYSITPRGVGLRPWSPSQLRATWQASGDILLTWLRRTRFGGDAWDPPDVPLNEDSEQYEVEILNGAGSAVVRTITGLGAPAYLYQTAEQVADFGALLTSVKFRVYQMSGQIGRGTAATKQ
ncbi:glycoside hydrolase/phage tail family protein [Methylosinus sp. Ce-a6]|uniref:baseplate multidomain protein megatron n=1 Tax=Methylosinus sp. Ce-a6 TaxID=2172005 RepID=UPI00135C09CD|nr:glycoside hydrolase/phage tail family protein [Methylosinus sp. Ce-a6]